jgi:hypothetical protein
VCQADQIPIGANSNPLLLCGCPRFHRRSICVETIESKYPRAHTANVRKEFRILIDHLRGDIEKIDDPKAQALFETAAEVISGLDTAFEHYEEKSESAWK